MKVQLHKAHPWHGISFGDNAPDIITCYIEMVPADQIKYEIDKASGYRKVDRPQKFSNIVPALYGFVPQTYCGDSVAELANLKTGRTTIVGDKDPLDICVLTERNIPTGDIIMEAIPIGGFRMIDKNEADDKIIAVMAKDEIYNKWRDISDVPEPIINRLRHYFLTYKNIPGESNAIVEITETYGREVAHDVIRRSMSDYNKTFKSFMDLGM
jgi:inorganic pyrophosphatase